MKIGQKRRSARTGGIYIVVLGTSMIVAVLGLAAMLAHRIQNRLLTASADVRQAQLNAHTAVELALLTTKQSSSWRTQLDASSYLFTNKSTGTGSTCSLKITDALADPATATADRPITLLGIGYHGVASGGAPRTTAAQRVEATVDPRRQPHDCLKQGSTATPVWQTIFDYYGGLPTGIGTQITFASLSSRTPSFARNPSFSSNNTNFWESAPPGLPVSDFDGPLEFRSHSECLRVERSNKLAGAANSLNVVFLKPATQYRVSVEVHAGYVIEPTVPRTNRFRISLITRYADNSFVQYSGSATMVTGGWETINSIVETPAWSQPPAAVYVVINSDHSSGTSHTFHVDNIDVYEGDAGFIYQKVLGPGINTLYSGAPTSTSEGKTHGVYWINCGGQKLVIERSRIAGTLLVLNPGAGSRLAYGPNSWSPAIPGYPALLVNGDFTVAGTLAADPRLRELENLVNYNPPGAPHRDFGTDNWSDGVVVSEVNDYESQIHGLIGISGNVTYQYSAKIRGRVLVGGSITGTPTFEYRPDSLLNPPPPLGVFYTYRYDRRPASTRKAVQ